MPNSRSTELLEPGHRDTYGGEIVAIVSIAISLKRIADMLEQEKRFQSEAATEQATKPTLIR